MMRSGLGQPTIPWGECVSIVMIRCLEDFDIVVDCSGFYDGKLANWVGKGGLPALGERSLRPRLWTQIPDVLGKDRQRFAQKRSMVARRRSFIWPSEVVGAGMSAATTLRDLVELTKDFHQPSLHLAWARRSRRLKWCLLLGPFKRLRVRQGDQESDGALHGDRRGRATSTEGHLRGTLNMRDSQRAL